MQYLFFFSQFFLYFLVHTKTSVKPTMNNFTGFHKTIFMTVCNGILGTYQIGNYKYQSQYYTITKEKRVGKFEKLRQNQQLKDDAMFVYLCWTQSVASCDMKETL